MKSVLFILTGLISLLVHAQPQPGDVFKDHPWLPTMAANEQGKFLRVGGKLDYQLPENFPASYHKDGYLKWEQFVELENAIKAELIIEKLASHDDTKGLRISVNGNAFTTVPAIPTIPEPEWDYMHHTNPIVPLPLEQLQSGWGNRFKLEVDPDQRWGWPQNIIYGVTLRVYYEPTEYWRSLYQLNSPPAPESLGESVELALRNPTEKIRHVDYVGYLEDVSFAGDGVYERWHYFYFRGHPTQHLGRATEFPFDLSWDTSWVPDQSNPFKVTAWVTDLQGYTVVVDPVDGLSFERPYNVTLCRPYDQPANWVTREAEYQAKFDFAGDPNRIEAVQAVWTSWSPNYANGVYLNETKIFDRSPPAYEYATHRVTLDGSAGLRRGVNTIITGLEPLHDGQMVHGMEVQWPGIQVLVRSR